mmetsp:Transcript_26466/g.30501  ORF Transcript_26466/g.30501 Transcript_26466/m.30501 type:complete len:145 (+) Transcript_26466:410-844(+)
MTTLDIIVKCVLELKERTGSSRQAIKKYLAANEKKEIKTHVLNAALKKGVADGKLVMVKASYKVSADTKKALTKKAAPKKKAAAPKKKKATATKKKKTAPKKKASSKKKTTTTKKKVAPKKKTATKKKAAPKKKKSASSPAKKQ